MFDKIKYGEYKFRNIYNIFYKLEKSNKNTWKYKNISLLH